MPPIKLELPFHWRQWNRLLVEPRKSQGLVPMVSSDDYERERDGERPLTRRSGSRPA
jgi:hypothetical protein